MTNSIFSLKLLVYYLPFYKDFAGRGAQNMKAMHSFMLSIFLQIEVIKIFNVA